MERMKKRVELPLAEPIYSAYNLQVPGTATLAANPSIRNWYLNQVVMLTCTRRFLKGFTTPEVSIEDSCWEANPYLEKWVYEMRFLEGHTGFVIRKLLDAGYYVCFNGIDDYYVEGKSWYHERHFSHDGCICGYDRNEKTYCLYAYDQSWRCRKFWTPQKSFEAGRRAQFKLGQYGGICGIKPSAEQVEFSCGTALERLAEYLDSDTEKYPEDAEGTVRGIAVHDYVAKYIGRLFDGSVPYERTDHRVFRVIWEHKKAMLQRFVRIETAMLLGHAVSEAYRTVVREADHCRMLYAAHQMKRRNDLLPVIGQKLLDLKAREQRLSEELLRKAERGAP